MSDCPRCGKNHYDTSRPTVPVCPFVPTLPSTPVRFARLVMALRSIANNTCCVGCQEAARVARSALATYERGAVDETTLQGEPSSASEHHPDGVE